MKIIPGWRRRPYFTRASVILTIAALIAGMVGCDGTQEYNLSISSTSGGNVIHPGTGIFTYPAGAVVLLEVVAEEGYGFTHWSGNVSTISDVNSTTTSITMDGHYLITANFAYGNLIQTWYDLDAVRDNLAGSYILMNDLDSMTVGYTELASPTANGGKGWQPIGAFSWTFDGQGYEICDLFINRPKWDQDDVGLFGSLGEGGVIKNVDMMNVSVNGRYNVGGLMGMNYGTVNNSYSTGNVHGTSDVGGLVGENRGTVRNSSSTASVTATSWPYAGAVGGLVGDNAYSGAVINSYSTGSVTGDRYIGGLVGVNKGNISNSYSTGSVTGDKNVNGLIGYNEGTVYNSYYNYDEVLINGENVITIGALFSDDFDQWLANDKFLDVNERLSQEDGYYVINDVTDFKELLAFGQNASLKFRLKNDLDLATEPDFYIPYLAGEFDGNGHNASALSLNLNLASPLGLFGYLAPSGNIIHMSVENINITGWRGVGGLVGQNMHGTVSNCHSTGSVTGMPAGDEAGSFIGGLVGQNMYGTVSNSYFSGSVSGESSVGGLVGRNYGNLNNSYSSGSVSAIEGGAGGLVGANGDAGTVSNSHSTASVTSEHNVGGLVGTNAGTVSKSYSTGSVTGDQIVGGLVGQSWGTVSNSYSTASATGDERVGGLVGVNSAGAGTVINSYSTGNVTGNSSVGGLVGVNSGTSIVSNSFWDTETSGQATSDGGTGKNTTEMQNITTFSGAGWNIVAVANSSIRNPSYIWNIVDEETYSFLSWQS